MQNDNKENAANEPAPHYQSSHGNEKTLKIFNSLQEQEDDNYKWLASLTPVQHLQNGTANIKRIFSHELKKKPGIGTNLTFS